MDKYKKKRIIRAAAVLTFAALLLMPCLPIHGEAEIYRKVLRLHVIADSDSPEDQSIKLSVRDAVLDVIPDILGECRTYDEAKTALADENNQAVLLAAARERLKELGAGCDAAITSARSIIRPANTTACACRRGSTPRSASCSAPARAKTGGACSFRRSACRRRAAVRRPPAVISPTMPRTPAGRIISPPDSRPSSTAR